jgi:hypothetical protein
MDLEMQTSRGQMEIRQGIHLDVRRAVYLEATRTLLMADVHLGFEWVQRRRGQMLPLGVPEDGVDRLRGLVRDWGARRVMVLGDWVHAAVELAGVREAVERFVGVAPGVMWKVVLGNHDRGLGAWLSRWGMGVETVEEWEEGGHRFVHGDGAMREGCGDGWVFSGHEHPALEVGRPGEGQIRVPAFVVGREGVILPAFSSWAAGAPVGRGVWMGEWARRMTPERVVACMGARLLPVPASRVIAGRIGPRTEPG